MADVITRLRLESGEYDNKIKRATQGLLRMEEECRRVGGTLGILEKDQKQYVESLGRMETVSKSARGRLSELTKAYEELAVQYRRLTDEEKNGDFGKALQRSLGELKERIGETKEQLKEVKDEMDDTGEGSDELGGILDELAGKFGLSTKALGALGVALAAVTAAVKVAKDAFQQNEELVDDWGRTMEQATLLYEGFLVSLNTGDISGFLERINQITYAAAEAYNALDELGTFNAFNQINLAKSKWKMTEAIANYREGTGTREEAQAAAEAYKAELAARARKEQDSYDALLKSTAAKYGVDEDLLEEVMKGDYSTYEDYKELGLTGTTQKYVPAAMGWGRGEYVDVPVAANKEEKIGEMLRLFGDPALDALQKQGAKAFESSTEIAQVDRQMNRMLGVGSKTPTPPSGGWSPIAMGAVEGFDTNSLVKPMSGFEEAYNKDFSKVKVEEKKQEKVEVKMNESLGDISSGIGNVVGGLEQLGITIPDGLQSAIGVMQTISSILSGIAATVMAIQLIAGADAIIPFSEGGVVKAATGFAVPGNFRSGDRVPALLNSGEVVLNRAQQGNLLSQMGGMGMSGMHDAQPYVDGEKIWLGLRNYLKRSGRGEILTSRG